MSQTEIATQVISAQSRDRAVLAGVALSSFAALLLECRSSLQGCNSLFCLPARRDTSPAFMAQTSLEARWPALELFHCSTGLAGQTRFCLLLSSPALLAPFGRSRSWPEELFPCSE